jgi:hypothetical protein
MIPVLALEKSSQEIPRTPEHERPFAPSMPLHGLEDKAPLVNTYFDFDVVRHPFSNDESAAYWDQLRARTLTTEYREAANRTAVVVGESSLMAALPFIAEETVVVVDKSPDMIAYLDKYINALREAKTIEEWGDLMGFRGSKRGTSAGYAVLGLESQTEEWHSSGYIHPVDSEELYNKAHLLARQKAIIPWNADITKRRDMNRLGNSLKDMGANVTLLNLTNVMGCSYAFDDTRGFAKRLGALPVTPNVPIMTTSTITKIDPPNPMVSGYIVEATGPFFGLDNLKDHGGKINSRKIGSAYMRQYYHERSLREAKADELVIGLVDGIMAAVAQVEFIEDSDRHTPQGFQIHEIVSLGDGEEAKIIKAEELSPELQAILKDLLR